MDRLLGKPGWDWGKKNLEYIRRSSLDFCLNFQVISCGIDLKSGEEMPGDWIIHNIAYFVCVKEFQSPLKYDKKYGECQVYI